MCIIELFHAPDRAAYADAMLVAYLRNNIDLS